MQFLLSFILYSQIADIHVQSVRTSVRMQDNSTDMIVKISASGKVKNAPVAMLHSSWSSLMKTMHIATSFQRNLSKQPGAVNNFFVNHSDTKLPDKLETNLMMTFKPMNLDEWKAYFKQFVEKDDASESVPQAMFNIFADEQSKLDLDGFMRLTAKLNSLRVMFNAIDTNSDGKVELDELQVMFDISGEDGPENLDDVIKGYLSFGNREKGYLYFDEFVAAFFFDEFIGF